jgi:DNA-binding PadR family transcriptional regulator
MHGYQLMQEIATRTGGGWRPSPGAVYPTIALLEDEGYVEVTRDGSRQLVSLTDAGRTYLAENRERFGDPFTARTREGLGATADVLQGLVGAVKQVMRSGSPTQVAAATKLLDEARRSLYLILADDPGEPEADTATTD